MNIINWSFMFIDDTKKENIFKESSDFPLRTLAVKRYIVALIQCQYIITFLPSDFDGPKNPSMGKQEDCRVHRRGGTHTVRLHLSESDGTLSTTHNSQ